MIRFDSNLICQPDIEGYQVCITSFLGHNLMKEGILPDAGNVAKIMNWLVSKTVHDVRDILGLISHYHHFIRNFSDRV